MRTVNEWIIVTQNNEYGVGGDRCTPTSSLSRSEQWNTIKVDRMPCFCSNELLCSLSLSHTASHCRCFFRVYPESDFLFRSDCVSLEWSTWVTPVRNTSTHTGSVVMFGSSFLVFIILFNANERERELTSNNIFDHKARRASNDAWLRLCWVARKGPDRSAHKYFVSPAQG